MTVMDVLSNMLLELRGVCQDFVQESVRHSSLNRPVFGDNVWVQVLPKRPPVASPPLAVRHECEADLSANADMGR